MRKQFIQESIRNNNYRITTHATQRRLERGISIKDIKSILITGEIIYSDIKAKPYPKAIVLGHTKIGNPIHVVVSKGDTNPKLRIVTVYEPRQNIWGKSFRKMNKWRRK